MTFLFFCLLASWAIIIKYLRDLTLLPPKLERTGRSWSRLLENTSYNRWLYLSDWFYLWLRLFNTHLQRFA
jgi:hypothetical protein